MNLISFASRYAKLSPMLDLIFFSPPLSFRLPPSPLSLPLPLTSGFFFFLISTRYRSTVITKPSLHRPTQHPDPLRPLLPLLQLRKLNTVRRTRGGCPRNHPASFFPLPFSLFLLFPLLSLPFAFCRFRPPRSGKRIVPARSALAQRNARASRAAASARCNCAHGPCTR